MKVINFLEWFELHYGFNGVGTAIEAVQTVTMKMQSVSNFYSQPFKPELITELFEGWKENEQEREYDATSETLIGTFYEKIASPYDAEIAFPMLDVEMMLTIMVNCGEDWDGLTKTFLYPKTLNDFISDCQRAGIELTWKSEIERKYFV